MDIGSDQNKDEYDEMTLDSEPSTLDPTNDTYNSKTAVVIDSDDEIKATEKILEDYYDAKIYHNHPYLTIIQ